MKKKRKKKRSRREGKKEIYRSRRVRDAKEIPG